MSVTESTISFDLSTVPEQDRERVASLIPDPRFADAYVHRSVRGFHDFDLFDLAAEEKENILFVGPTGSSKSSAFRAYAASRGLPYFRLDSNASTDPATIVGQTKFRPDGTVSWVDGDLTLVARYGGVIVIEEANMAHQRVQAAWQQLLDVSRRLSLPENNETVAAGRGGLGAPQPTLFAATYNDRYQGTVRLNEAFRNRFPMPFSWGYDREVEETLMTSTRLLDMAENVRSLAEIRSPLSTNMLMEFERHAARVGMDLAAYWFVQHFEPEERGPVARALEANAAAIAQELGLTYTPGTVTASDYT